MKPVGKTHKKTKKIQISSDYMPQACIYLLTNLTNGKRYVGQYKDIATVERRWARHIGIALNTNDTRPLYRAIRKRWDRDKCFKNITAEILWHGAADVKKLDTKETYYIKKLHSFIDDPKGDRSYNLTKGGRSGILGFKFSDESRKRLSELHLLRWANLEEHERASEAQLRSYAENPERRKRQSIDRQRWLKEWPTAHAELSALQSRRYENQEEREKTGAASKASWAKKTFEERSEIQLRSYAAHPERNAQQSAGTTRRYEDPGEREKQRVIQNKRFESQAERDKTGAAAKANWAKKTPAERSAIGIKSRDTRRANKAAKAKAAKKK